MTNSVSESRRIVVTGLGVFTALGRNIEEFFESLVVGRTGISEIENIPIARGKRLATQIRNPPLGTGYRVERFASEVIREALRSAGLSSHQFRIGLFLGTSAGESYELERRASEFRSAELANRDLRRAIVSFPTHALCDALARRFNLRGPRSANTNACAAGNIAVACAIQALRRGSVDVAVVCGAEQLRPTMYWGAERAGILGSDIRPFHAGRNGTILGDGAAAVILEESGHAAARGARVLAECAGFGVSCSDHPDEIMPPIDGGGVARAILDALDDAHELAESVDHINAHATGTVNIEIAECAGLRVAFGNRVDKIPVTATKSYSGHLAGASAVLEIVATVLAIDRGFIHPIARLDEPDESLGITFVREPGLWVSPKCAISISMGAGGVNSAIVLRPWSVSPPPTTTLEGLDDDEIWVTGVCPVSPAGIGLDPFLDTLFEFRPLIGKVSCASLRQSFKGFPRYERYNRAAQLGLVATVLAIHQANLDTSIVTSKRFGLLVGTWLGGNSTWSDLLCKAYEQGPKHITPFMALSHGAHLSATLIARELQIIGPTLTLTDGVTAGFGGLAHATQLLRSHKLDAAVVCSTDIVDQTIIQAYKLLGNPSAMLSDGAAAFVLERADTVRLRGGRPLARLMNITEGYGIPGRGRYDSVSLLNAMQAMKSTCGEKELVIFSCSTGMDDEDLAEASALNDFTTSRLGRPPYLVNVSSLLGHAGSATPMLAFAVAIGSLSRALVPSSNTMPKYPVDRIIYSTTKPYVISPNACAMVMALAPGGLAACLGCDGIRI